MHRRGGVIYVSFQRRMTRVSRSKPSTLTLPVERNRRPPKRRGLLDPARAERAQDVAVGEDRDVAVDRPGSPRRRGRSGPPTSAGVSPSGTPSRHRYQPGCFSRISGVVMPS